MRRLTDALNACFIIQITYVLSVALENIWMNNLNVALFMYTTSIYYHKIQPTPYKILYEVSGDVVL